MADRDAEFARFADQFADPLLLIEIGGRIRAANEAARRRLLGRAAPAADSQLENFVEDARDKLLAYLRICARSSRKMPGTLTFPDGREPGAWHCEGSAFGDRNGAPLVMLRLLPKHESVQRFVSLNQRIGELRDEVARRVSAERSAVRQRELLHVTLSSIGDGVITTDGEGAITFMNGVAAALTGWEADEAQGRMLEEIFAIRNEVTGEVVESPMRKVLREGMVVGLANHTVLIRKDGTQLPIDDSGAPIRDREGRLFGVVLVFHEITERRRMERELIRQADALREADRRKDEFLAMLAHELRNPLASLRNVVQLFQLRGAETDTERLVEIMDRQTVQLSRLVDDLLDVARITRGTIRLERQPMPLAHVIGHAVETVRPLMDEKGHRLSVELPPETLIVNADLTRLSQVFGNLLSNAAKFTDPGGKIELSARIAADQALVTVSDTGRGMDLELASRVFELFSQGTRSLERTEGGLGIGLTLVKTLVEMHDGSVSASSEGPGQGSTFSVSLPIAENGRVSTPVPEKTDASLAIDVLIVDDNRDAAESLATVLGRLGCRTHTVLDGAAAIDVARSEPLDVVLLDIGLPGMDGYEVARHLRELPGLSRLRIIAISGYSPGFGAGEGAAEVFDEHLTKPVDVSTLWPLISAADDT